YEGHIPAFSFLTLNRRSLDEPSVDAAFERLFERGIDPSSLDDARRHERADWPSRERIAAFAAECDRRVRHALRTAVLSDPANPRLAGGQAVYTMLEHEQEHHETLLYIFHQLPYDRKTRIEQVHRDGKIAANEPVEIPAGVATLGASTREIPFGWDNEFARNTVDVPAFAIATFPVTNADWLAFVADGGPRPPFWTERDGDWVLRGAFEELPLPLSWPVYVSHLQATQYARWAGMELPTEAQYHRAAYGTSEGVERAFPWGFDAPSARYGNFDFARYDPEPVDAHPAGASAWGIYDLVGNGWEWTSTPFEPFAGFEAMASYPQYSADFFDGEHFVMKGASPVTSRELVRRSFRNWFYDDYPYVYAKFRVVAQT
ncbi:MAG: SUMF1/EgtB/PvdO family nonheme iron enzyme, partial [Candidatus Eremiobacteraeota bacterium]|nr:SUMF1/EgtB/PvdO family nonheme iron enzyme [Candidatus Eremiobacteraeota bacterium]